MIKLKIVNIDGYQYYLEDEDKRNYIFNLEFLDVEDDIKVGNFINISAELLNPRYAGYSTNYTFGSLESKYGKDKIKLNDIDVIKIETEDKEIYLKRLYG